MPLTLPTSGAAIDTVTWDTISSAALFNIQPKLWDNFITSKPLLALLGSKAKITFDGGEYIKRDIRYGESTAIKPFTKSTVMDVAGFEDRVPARADWRNFYGSVMTSNLDTDVILKKQDMGAQLNLFTEGIDYVQRGYKTFMNRTLYLDGSGNAGLDVLGLAAHCDTSPTTGVIMGLDRAQYDWFRNTAVNMSGLSWAIYGINGTGTDYFVHYRNLVSDGEYGPNVVVTTYQILENYEAQIPETFTVTSMDRADLGVGTLTWKGIPFVPDHDCPTGYVYMLDMNTWEFVVSSEYNFTSTGWVDLLSAGRLAKANYILLRCNLLCMRPMSNLVFYNWTT